MKDKKSFYWATLGMFFSSKTENTGENKAVLWKSSRTYVFTVLAITLKWHHIVYKVVY